MDAVLPVASPRPKMRMKNAKPRRRQARWPRLATRSSRRTALRFTPYAWAKLLFLRDAGSTEVGGFGISSANDLLLVEDIGLVTQHATMASVEFDDISVADFFDRQVDAGRTPQEFGRIWLHTHPGDCPRPSGTDEATFARVFGDADWAVMGILACGGAAYARLHLAKGPGGDWRLPVEIDFDTDFPAADPEGWQAEYDANVINVDGWRGLGFDAAERLAQSRWFDEGPVLPEANTNQEEPA